MNMNDIVSLVGSLGFPIVACVACFMEMRKTREDMNAALEKRDQQHADEINGMREALENNTVALTRLAVMLGASDDVESK